jgi:hypothetical protein
MGHASGFVARLFAQFWHQRRYHKHVSVIPVRAVG